MIKHIHTNSTRFIQSPQSPNNHSHGIPPSPQTSIATEHPRVSRTVIGGGVVAERIHTARDWEREFRQQIKRLIKNLRRDRQAGNAVKLSLTVRMKAACPFKHFQQGICDFITKSFHNQFNILHNSITPTVRAHSNIIYLGILKDQLPRANVFARQPERSGGVRFLQRKSRPVGQINNLT